MMAQIVPARINNSWVNISGQLLSPKRVFITDSMSKNAISSLTEIGVNDTDAFVQIMKGDFETADAFLHSKTSEYAEVETFIFLWYGGDEIAEAAPPPGSCPPVVEQYFLKEGPRIMPRLSVSETVAKYTASIRLCLDTYPSATVVSTDPPPRRSTGFAMSRANFVASSLLQQDGRHRHLKLNRFFHGKLKHGNHGEGGRYPIHESKFVDGVVPTLESWAALIRRVYAALASFSNGGAVSPEQQASLKLVQIAF